MPTKKVPALSARSARCIKSPQLPSADQEVDAQIADLVALQRRIVDCLDTLVQLRQGPGGRRPTLRALPASTGRS
jgi:hypothetical protein